MTTNNASNPDGNPVDKLAERLGAAIGKRIAILLDSRGLTARDIENHTGMGKGSIAQITSGRRGARISVFFLAHIADALDVDMTWLITGRLPADKTPLLGLKEHGVPDLSSSRWPASLRPLASPIQNARRAREK